MNAPPPLIGLTGRRKVGAQVAGFPANLDETAMDVFVNAYAAAVSSAGGLPVLIPLHVDAADYTGRLDGLVLVGGADIQPGLYGAESETDVYPPEPIRDRLELGLVDVAMADGIPMLGICRGLQVLNVWAGGTLHQHVPDHACYARPPDETVDEARLVPGTRIHELYGDRRRVNSLHHQTVDRLADGWTLAGRSEHDGTVEAIELPGHDVLAVQWHPELMRSRDDDPIFRWLVERAAVAAERRHSRPVARV